MKIKSETVEDWASLLKDLQETMKIECTSNDNQPCIIITIGYSPGRSWNYQKLYGLCIYRDSNTSELAREIANAIEELIDTGWSRTNG